MKLVILVLSQEDILQWVEATNLHQDTDQVFTELLQTVESARHNVAIRDAGLNTGPML
ncbi:hypothetical protein GCM10011273_17820 [Asticcacaulis endophyticus]|uniref:Uncharacterized protein n=1 Tax=Asticcacaulis endophyticus TaxID=1395890 RepID=A0A918Q4X3_9CAUL|nr:hypothetical protein GCM10011273_17820 [Asticcacaulis endophyticus]